jgi:hypothetical protein
MFEPTIFCIWVDSGQIVESTPAAFKADFDSLFQETANSKSEDSERNNGGKAYQNDPKGEKCIHRSVHLTEEQLPRMGHRPCSK